MSGQGKESNRKISKHEALAAEYAKPGSSQEGDTGPNYRDFGRVSVIGDDHGVVAQESGARLWYALANALAEKAIADLDRGDVETDRPGGRRDEEA